MNFRDVCDEELIQIIEETRRKLDDYEAKLNQADNSVDKAAMRALMTTFNHLKLETNRRGLDLP